jgi:hypothetical protein
MTGSLRALLTGLIDYAGLFPPARLPLDQALANYVHYQTEPEAWMLGRFICPASRLAELAELLPRYLPAETSLTIAALGRGGKTRKDFLSGVEADSQDIQALAKQLGARVQVDVYEARMPTEDAKSLAPRNLSDLLLRMQEMLSSQAPPSFRIFLEGQIGTSWRRRMRLNFPAVAQVGGSFPVGRPGLKLRCGGEQPSAIPTVEQVAGCLRGCIDYQVPFKATAGLHHPIRHFDPTLQTPMHGFVNLFGAGVLAATRALEEQQIQDILKDEDASHFRFTENQFTWGDWSASTEAIAALRRDALISFGSCSFDEPRDDLRALGWL